jgi:peroxiredoxin
MPPSLRHAFAAATGLAVLVALLAVTVTSFGETTWGVADSGPAVGSRPPPFALPVVANGEGELTLDETLGRPLVVEVFASWCKYCDRASATVAAASRAERQHDVRFVGVSLDEHPDQAIDAASEWDLPYEVLHDDGTLTRGWEISALPTIVVLDAAGHVRHVFDEAPSSAQLERCLAGIGARRVR